MGVLECRGGMAETAAGDGSGPEAQGILPQSLLQLRAMFSSNSFRQRTGLRFQSPPYISLHFLEKTKLPESRRSLIAQAQKPPSRNKKAPETGAFDGAPDRGRTYNLLVRSQMLYPLSYRREHICYYMREKPGCQPFFQQKRKKPMLDRGKSSCYTNKASNE